MIQGASVPTDADPPVVWFPEGWKNSTIGLKLIFGWSDRVEDGCIATCFQASGEVQCRFRGP